MKFSKYALPLLAFVFVSTYSLADPEHLVPSGVVIGYYAVLGFIGISISIVGSFLLRIALQKLRGEKRSHLWFMVGLSFLLPLVFSLLTEKYDLLKSLDSFETQVLMGRLIIIGLALVGFFLGYFFTPKKPTVS